MRLTIMIAIMKMAASIQKQCTYSHKCLKLKSGSIMSCKFSCQQSICQKSCHILTSVNVSIGIKLWSNFPHSVTLKSIQHKLLAQTQHERTKFFMRTNNETLTSEYCFKYQHTQSLIDKEIKRLYIPSISLSDTHTHTYGSACWRAPGQVVMEQLGGGDVMLPALNQRQRHQPATKTDIQNLRTEVEIKHTTKPQTFPWGFYSLLLT